MIILAIETATLTSGVALLDGDRVCAVRRTRVTTHSETLLAQIRDALDEARVPLGALAAIACGAGPGSFTGLRIGLATAKGLCFALGLPLVLVPSLQALAARAPRGALAAGVLDAFKGEVYAGFYRLPGPAEPPVPIPEGVEIAAPPARLALLLAERAAREPAPIHLIGDGALRWPELAISGLVASDCDPPDPIDVARIAGARLLCGATDDLDTAAPRYVRPSEAELHAPGAAASLPQV